MTLVTEGSRRARAAAPGSARRGRGPQPDAALYTGTVRHHRTAAPPHTFTPKLFLAYLDVDALPGALDRVPLWSARRCAPVHFRRRDFFDGTDRPLGAAVRDLVEQRLGRRPAGRVHLLAHLRTFGWVFNPMAAYYCWTADGRALDAIVLEVTNTPWGERHWYVFDAAGGRTTARAAKAMHVSPFLPMDADYRVTWTAPGPQLTLQVCVEQGGTPIFRADLALRRRALDRRTGPWIALRRPLMPLRASIAIYREALALFLRRARVYRHPARRPERGGS